MENSKTILEGVKRDTGDRWWGKRGGESSGCRMIDKDGSRT